MSENGTHRGIHRPRRPQYGEGSADEEDEEDDLVRSAETPGNGGQAGQGRHRRCVRREVEAARHHLESSGGILHAVEFPGGKCVRENLGQDHHPEEDDQGMWDLEAALGHGEPCSPFTYLSNQSAG